MGKRPSDGYGHRKLPPIRALPASYTQLTFHQCGDAGIHRASFTLEDDDWRDQGASDQEFYSQITLEGTHPAIAVYRQVHTIDEVQVDLDTGGTIETTVIQESP